MLDSFVMFFIIVYVVIFLYFVIEFVMNEYSTLAALLIIFNIAIGCCILNSKITEIKEIQDRYDILQERIAVTEEYNDKLIEDIISYNHDAKKLNEKSSSKIFHMIFPENECPIINYDELSDSIE